MKTLLKKLREKGITRSNLSADHKRNMKVLVIASILNISFAVEKVLLTFDIDLGNAAWAMIYGSLALCTTYIAFHDYVFDIIEDTDSTKSTVV